jgi:hypothetical protein
MQTSIVPFVGGSYEYRSRGISAQVSMNLYPEIIEDEHGKDAMTLVYTPGEQLIATIGPDTSSACRGFWYSSTGPDSRSLLYACYGNKIYRINPEIITNPASPIAVIEIGTVASGTGPVSITDNGFKGVVADGVTLFEFDLVADNYTVAATWQQTDLPYLSGTTDPIKPSVVKFLNQRLIINSQRGEFYFSQLASTSFEDDDGIAQFYSAESSADAINALTVISNRIYVWGERSYEIWSASGTNNDNPFAFLQGSSSQIGVQAPRSLANLEEKVFFLGGSDAGLNTVFMIHGINPPVRISNNAIENKLSTIADPAGAVGWCYYSEGHLFYVLSFRDAKETLVYDTRTNLWHNRSTRDWNTTEDLAWEPLYGVQAYNRIFHGGASGNNFIQLDTNKYTDYNDKEVVRQRIGPIYYSNFNPITCREFFIDMEVGSTPLLTGLGRDPQAVLDISRDGGNTWVNLDWRSIGSQGDYMATVKWTNLGMGRTITGRLTFSDPSPIIIYGARITFEESSRR